MTNDQEYVKEQFKICALLMQKIDLLRELKGSRSRNKPQVKTNSQSIKSEIKALNSKIKKEDRLFWQKAESSLKKSSHFAMEEFASHYLLDHFEKRVLLFLFYLEFHRPSNVISRDEILALLDFDDSAIARIRNLRYFATDSQLFLNDIAKFEDIGTSHCSYTEYSLSHDTMVRISKMMNGDIPDWGDKKSDDVPICDRIGFIKQPGYTLDNVMVKPDIKEKIRFFIEAFNNKDFETIGASETIRNSKSLIFLFYGPPGTGKTMLAEAISKNVGKKMLIVEYPKIMGKWLGDTDRNISSAFRAARENDLVLVMDEADSLLYNRSYAAQEHDIRFVNDMLQELERYEGIVILTTNMDALLDQALERRVSLKVKFDLPDEAIRAEIWRSHIPSTVKLGEEIDFSLLARQYDFSGGYISNAVLTALRRLSLRKENRIMMADLIFGAETEKQGMFNKDQKRKIIGFASRS